ncbi:MAG TPA: hypothetical protein VJO33_17140 [Gemmatimonadaceae bacterium]|nr:hypothetical protein [Gemmatimonadaceae bacterium]
MRELVWLQVLAIVLLGAGNIWLLFDRREHAKDIDEANAACRDHNLRANRAESETDRVSDLLDVQRQRAESLDAALAAQNATVANLWSGNEQLVKVVSDMRRLGFEMPLPKSSEPPDELSSVEDDDREALKRDKTLVAHDD